jgi:RNA polymerase sigma-70 factor (ECF subfamily)
MADANEKLVPIEQLIDGCIKGNRHSQTQLYNVLMQRMFGVCLRYCNNPQEAEEVLQEGFMKVFEFIHQYKFEGAFEGWVRKIMVNCALQKYRRKQQLRPVVDIDATEVGDTGHEEIISRIGTKELLKMVQQLPPAYRLVFNLYVFEGMKHREIAGLLNISEGTSKSNLSDARFLLQKAVKLSLQSPKVNYN